ncbi:hypothetical protein J4417_02115 [Candidatus Woesearchaeota archaeon]|nr:hypothetical protein [Candidatus Woesearchaeota archaeon]
MDNLTRLVLAAYESDTLIGFGIQGILNKKAKKDIYANGLHHLYFEEGFQQWITKEHPVPVPMFCEHYILNSKDERQAVCSELWSVIQTETNTVERLKKTLDIYLKIDQDEMYPGDYLQLAEEGFQRVPFRQIVPKGKDTSENHFQMMSVTPSSEIASQVDLKLILSARFFFGNKYRKKFFPEQDWQERILSTERHAFQEYAALMDIEQPTIAQEIREYLSRAEIVEPLNKHNLSPNNQ